MNKYSQNIIMGKTTRFIFVAFVIILFTFWIGIEYFYKKEIDKHLENETAEFEIVYNAMQNSFKLMTKTITNQAIIEDKVLKLYSEAYHADTIKQKEIRDSLYNILSPTYEYLKINNIKLLHFHLPNNVSFLRMHQPNLYGDDLTDYRYSVRMTNKNQESNIGFEIGRIHNGFRHVFPLFYNSKYIGCVDIAISFNAIRTQLKLYNYEFTGFMIKEEIIEAKIFENEKNHYSLSSLSDDYMYEKEYTHYALENKEIFRQIDEQIKGRIASNISQNKNFTTYEQINENIYLISFISISNIEGKPVGYIFSYQEDFTITNIKKRKLATLFITISVSFLILIIISLLIRNKRINQWNKNIIIKNDILRSSEIKLRQKNEDLHKLNKKIEKQNEIILENEQRLETIINNQAEGFAITDLEEKILFTNPKFDEIFEVKRGELIGKNLKKFVDEKEWNKLQYHTKKRKQNKNTSYELVVQLSNNIKKYLHVSGAPNYDISGNITGTIGITRDITDSKKKEHKLNILNHELEKYYTVISQSPVSIIFTDIIGNIEYVNSYFTKITGYSLEEIKGKNSKILQSGKTPKETYLELWKTLTKGEIWTGNFINKTKDGKEFIEKSIIAPIKNEEGIILNYVSVKEDITILEKTQKKIKEQNKQFNNLIDKMNDIYAKCDFKGNFIRVSHSIVQEFNCTNIDKVYESNLFEWLILNKKSQYFFYKKLLKDGAVNNFTFQFKRKKEKDQFAELNASIFYENNKPAGFEVIFRNTTKQTENDKKIKQQIEQQDILINNLPAHIYFKDANLKYILVNNSFAKNVGLPKEYILGKSDKDFLNNEANLYIELDKHVISNKQPILNYEKIHVNNNGEENWSLLSKMPYFDDQNNVIGIIGITRDITERKNRIIKLKNQKEKLENSHKDITDSIIYAKRIQEALLPSTNIFNEYIPENFILYKPRDIVGGDFYFIARTSLSTILIVADSTGHSIPGAFLSILGINLLKEIINDLKFLFEISASEILETMKTKFSAILNAEYDIKDGIDLSLIIMEGGSNKIQYSGAFNPLWIIRNNEIIKYKGTRNSIGYSMTEKKFENIEIQLQDNDLLYLFTDGYQDQFDKNGKKFTKKRLSDLLLKINSLPMNEQKNILEQKHNQWKGNCEQIDDVTIIGIKWNENAV